MVLRDREKGPDRGVHNRSFQLPNSIV